jgi:hypothetical protein
MSEQKVKLICGEYPLSFQKQTFESDANFIFENDPMFNAVRVFDSEDNVAYVNSFVECEHYVLGGWDQIPSVRREESFHTTFSVIIIGILLIRYIFRFKSRIKDFNNA